MTAEDTVAVESAQDDNAKKPKKEKPANLVIPPKKPKLSKAERRALQEAQRAAKAAGQKKPGGGDAKQQQQQQTSADSSQQQSSSSAASAAASSAGASKNSKSSTSGPSSAPQEQNEGMDKTVDLFRHLPQFRESPNIHSPEHSKLHPAVLKLGLEYASGAIRGGNARCRALLQCFHQVLDDYQPPADIPDYRVHLDTQVLKPSFTYWTIHCRPHSVSMGNAFTFLKSAVASMDRTLEWTEAKEMLQESIQQYLLERIQLADQVIAQHALCKIAEGDVILTLGHSEAVAVLLETACQTKNFFVWVVDSRPLYEGKILLKRLQTAGISCGYIHLNAVAYVIPKVTKALLGASALCSNGSIYGRVGTACVALLAKDHHIPTLVCCETYKISNRVQLESITHNEVGNPETLLSYTSNTSTSRNKEQPSPLHQWKEQPNLKLLNILYDVTPSEYISGICTEVGIIPPTSVAVLLREMHPGMAAAY